MAIQLPAVLDWEQLFRTIPCLTTYPTQNLTIWSLHRRFYTKTKSTICLSQRMSLVNGWWVYEIERFNFLSCSFARKMLPIIAYVNIIRSERSITRSYQSFKVTTVTKDVLLTVLGIAGDTTKILLGYKINPSCFLVKVTCSHKSMSISIIYIDRNFIYKWWIVN